MARLRRRKERKKKEGKKEKSTLYTDAYLFIRQNLEAIVVNESERRNGNPENVLTENVV